MKLIELQLCDLKPYENNPRLNDEAVDGVAESIRQFGYQSPIIIDNMENKVIIAGHTRYKALQKLGFEKVQCIVADDLTEEQVRAYRLADNKVAEKAQWDFELLDKELAGILNIDMSSFGFGDLDSTEEEKEIVEDIAPSINEEKEPKCKLGEIYELGNHRLMVGDSTESQQVLDLLGGEMADLVVTDPPYNVDYVGKTKDALKIENDKMSNDSFIYFLDKAFQNISLILKAGGAFYIWHAHRSQKEFENALTNNDLLVKEQLIWVKNILVFGRSDYQWKHEPCFYGWKEGASHYFTNDRTQTTVYEDAGCDFNKMKKEEAIQLLKDIFTDKVPTTIIHEDKPAKSELHPTMKPVKLIARLIKNSSREKELVVDLFGGSGSTMIACEQLNRKCYMMEYDPKYADVIIERWEKFTGQKARKISG